MEFEKFYEIFDKYGFNEATLRLKSSKKFQEVWFGAMPNSNKNELTYWIRSKEDDLCSDFSTLDALVDAKIFDGKSLKEIWDNVELTSLDGIDPNEYKIPAFEKSVVFECKHKELATYEHLAKDGKAWRKVLICPLIALLLSLIYFACSLGIITKNQPANTIVSSVLFGVSILTILAMLAFADKKQAQYIKQYSFSKEEKSIFYNMFKQYWKENFDEAFIDEEYNDDGLIKFGPFESCGGYKIKDVFILFVENKSKNLEIIFLNNYAKVWNKKNNDITTFNYDAYKKVEDLLNDIESKTNQNGSL